MEIPPAFIALCAGLIASASSVRATTVYSEDFESGAAPGFTLTSFWHATQNAPASGNAALGYVHDETAGPTPDGSYAGTTGVLELAYSPLIVLPGNGQPISFRFDARVDDEINGDPVIYDGLTVGVSTVAGNQGTVMASSDFLNPGQVAILENVGYRSYNVDLSAFAGQSVYLTFGFQTYDMSDNDHPGPRLDNLLITTPAAAVPDQSSTLALLALGCAGLLVCGGRKARLAESVA